MSSGEKKKKYRNAENENRKKRYAEDPDYREGMLARNRVSKSKHRERYNLQRQEKRRDPEFREQERIRDRATQYSMTILQYEQMFARQGGVCKICRTPTPNESLNVDHRHATRWVRGLLCRGCNTGLGSYRENPVWLVRAAIYIVVSLVQENIAWLFARLRRRCSPTP